MIINLLEEINKYAQKGYNNIYATSKVAQDIILTNIFNSKYKDNVTIKGGVVMSQVTKDKRRATIDIDLDLIKLYLEDNNLVNIFSTENKDGLTIKVDKDTITNLKHQDYKGKRINIKINDTFGNVIETKLDVGVHKDFNIIQDEISFNTFYDKKSVKLLANSKEQIFVEKTIPIIKFGLLTSRYKDFFDIYWLIKEGNLNIKRLNKIMNEKIIYNENINIYDIKSIYEIVKEIFEDKNFQKKLMNRTNNWIEVEYEELKNTILAFINDIKYI